MPLFFAYLVLGEKMYAALLNKRLVLAVEEANQVFNHEKKLNEEDYRCPHCQKKVILVLSQSKAAFFKHWIHYDEGQGEKEEHHNSKMLLKTAFTAAGFPAQTEIPLANGQLRADVLVNSKLALEVQCAPLSEQEFASRHSLYQRSKILDLWIVGKRHYLKKRLKHTQLIFFRENQIWGKYYLEVDPQKQVLRLKYNIWQEGMTPRLRYQVAIFPLDEKGIIRFWHFKPAKREYFLNIEQQRKYLWQQIHQKTKLGQKVAQELYEARMTIDELPAEIFAEWRKPGEADVISKFLQKKKATSLD